jgi:hypothetical protein
MLLDRGVDVLTERAGGWSALSEAACLGLESMVGLLLDFGMDVNTIDTHGRACLEIAAQREAMNASCGCLSIEVRM